MTMTAIRRHRSTMEQASAYRAQAAYFRRRAQNYQDIGHVRLADELRDVAKAFDDAADWLNQPWIKQHDPALHEVPYGPS